MRASSAAAPDGVPLRLLGADALLLPAMAPALAPRPHCGRRPSGRAGAGHGISERGGAQALGLANIDADSPPSRCTPACSSIWCGWRAWWRRAARPDRDGHWRGAGLIGRQGQLTRIDLRLRPGRARSCKRRWPPCPAGLRACSLPSHGDALQRVDSLSRAYRA